MSTITTRAGKGSPLTNNEVDANFTNLNTDKAELSGATFTGEITANGGLDVTGTATMDGLSVNAGANTQTALGNADNLVIKNSGAAGLSIFGGDANSQNIYFGSTTQQIIARLDARYNSGAEQLYFHVGADNKPKLLIADTGDISFYEDTGTTPKFFWDASAESLGLGTSSPSSFSSLANNLVVNSSTNTGITISESTGSGSSNILFAATSGFANRGNISYDHAATAMTFGINAIERLRIDSSGNVGIGTSSPSSGMQIKGDGKALKVSSADYDVGFLGALGSGGTALDKGYFYLKNTGTTKIQLHSDGDSYFNGGNVGIGNSSPLSKVSLEGGHISVGDLTGVAGTQEVLSAYRERSGTTTYGNISIRSTYNTGSNASDMLFYTSSGATTSAERMRIDSSGNLLVGTTVAPNTLLGASATQGLAFNGGSGYLVAAANNNTTAYFNRQGSDGTIVDFRKNGATVGQMNAKDGDMTIGTVDTGLRFYDIGDSVYPAHGDTGAGRDNAIDLGRTSHRFKDLYLSGGVYLGGTGAANKLDDYEEGTWTPTDASGQGITGFTLSNNQYTKIGRKVFAHCQITFPSSSNTTLARLSLPFAANANSNNSSTGGVCQEQNISDSVTVLAAVNYTNGVIFRPNGFGSYTYANLSGKTLRFTIHYNA